MVLLAVPSITFATSNEVNWSICESDTQCKKCLETGSVVIERKENKIVVSGKNPLGALITGDLTECDVKSDDNWTCNDFRTRIVKADGRVRIEYSREVTINGKQLELCSVQVR